MPRYELVDLILHRCVPGLNGLAHSKRERIRVNLRFHWLFKNSTYKSAPWACRSAIRFFFIMKDLANLWIYIFLKQTFLTQIFASGDSTNVLLIPTVFLERKTIISGSQTFSCQGPPKVIVFGRGPQSQKTHFCARDPPRSKDFSCKCSLVCIYIYIYIYIYSKISTNSHNEKQIQIADLQACSAMSLAQRNLKNVTVLLRAQCYICTTHINITQILSNPCPDGRGHRDTDGTHKVRCRSGQHRLKKWRSPVLRG